MTDETRAAILAGSISIAPLDPKEILERLQVPAVRRILRALDAPLDLRAKVFRYRVDRAGEIVALRDGGRVCRRHDHHR
ncbi:MAG TPA: hypothetical protein VF618_04900 [Thermoanaerobaculia bacterium]